MNFVSLSSKGKGVKLFLNPRAFQDMKKDDECAKFYFV